MEAALKLFTNNYLISFAHKLVTLTMIVWLVWGLATLTWLVGTDAQANNEYVNNFSLAQQKNKPAPRKYNIRSLSELHLFGKPQWILATPSQPKLANIKAPETRLNLKLMGLRRGSGSIPSSAIIEGPNKKQEIYYIGDKLPSGGAVVEEIFIQHMIISRQGKYETLTLFTVLSTKQVSEPVKEEVSTPNFTDLSSNKFITKKLNKYKGIALKEPSALNGVVNIKPVVDGEEFIGYQLSPGIDSIFFYRAGLKRGDVVTSINGVKLDNPNKVLSLMSSLALSSDLDLTIDRGGEPLSFRYTFK